MRAIFQVLAEQKDITELIADRLISIKTTDKPGMESDECEIHIDDRDSKVHFPRRGAHLEISLGYDGKGLSRMGTYVIDDIEISGPPQLIVLKGKAADMRADAKSHRRGAWEGVTLASIVADIAARHAWQAVCNVDAAIARADQIGESDIHFITRIARENNATATVKDGRLLVLPRGAGKTASGKELPVMVVKRSDVGRYSFHFSDRPAHGGVQTGWHNDKTGRHEVVRLTNPDAPESAPTHTDRHVYPDKERAEAAAKARLAGLNRSTADVRLEMVGRADIIAEQTVRADGFKADLDGEYLVDTVEHTFTQGDGWHTTIECNAGEHGKAKAGQGKKSGDLKTVRLDPP